MKISQKALACNLSPMRKFHPFAVAATNNGKKIYHLNIGQPDIATPPAYFEAVRNFELPVLEYAPSPGLPVLIKAVQDYYDKLGIHYEESDILITTGGSEALQMLMLSILDDGSEVIIPEPFYPNYNTFIKSAGGTIRPLTTSPEGGYRYAFREKLEALINENTRAIMFTNPGNPTGVVLTHEELRTIADVAKEHNLFVIGDEVYREFVYGGEQLATIGQFEDINENAVIIDSVSKRFSACGARIGTIITRNKELQQNLMKFCQARLSVATLDQIASAALYSVDSDYFDAVRKEYKLRRDTSDVKLQNNDEEKIQYDIDDSGDRQIIQRAFGISFGAQYRAAEVVDHHGRHAEKIDPHVQGGKRQNLLRRLHQFQNRRRDHNADDPHRNTRYDAQRDRGMYGLADIAFLARALISGRQYIAADSQPDKKINQKVNQG